MLCLPQQCARRESCLGAKFRSLSSDVYVLTTDNHFRPALTLLDSGADVSLSPDILHKAVSPGPRGSWVLEHYTQLVQKLVQTGADPNALWDPEDCTSSWANRPVGPVTPMFWALHTRGSCTAILQVLIDNGADPRVRNAHGKSYLFEAVQNVYMHGVEDISCLEFFLALGCDAQEV